MVQLKGIALIWLAYVHTWCMWEWIDTDGKEWDTSTHTGIHFYYNLEFTPCTLQYILIQWKYLAAYNDLTLKCLKEIWNLETAFEGDIHNMN